VGDDEGDAAVESFGIVDVDELVGPVGVGVGAENACDDKLRLREFVVKLSQKRKKERERERERERGEIK
jgi:hypothetical protein